MTRWERLLLELGVSEFDFEAAKFDLSPREWLKEKLRESDPEEGGDSDDNDDFQCEAPCCAEV